MGSGFYVISALMLAAGFAVAGWPLLRRRRVAPALLLAVALVAGGAGLYPLASNYVPESAAYEALRAATDRATAKTAADALAEELMRRPHDFRGWRLLGRARLELGEYADAEFALRQALRLAPGPDPELMLQLGQALSFGGTNRIPEEAADLFINAFKLAPELPSAMWYAGLAYAARGENLAAVGAWEALLARSPPPEIQRILREQIEVLRARATPAAAGDRAPAVQAGDAGGDAAITLQVRLAQAAPADWPQTARLFVSVRDAERPGPPLAARQFAPGALPVTLSLGDDDAMIAGRTISSAERYEIVARVSMNGNPLGGSGDWVGRLTVGKGDIDDPLELIIDEVTR